MSVGTGSIVIDVRLQVEHRMVDANKPGLKSITILWSWGKFFTLPF
jgi:hypothetical protein